MTAFYTYVQLYGDKIICHGYKGTKKFREEIKYDPYIFLQDPKSTEPYRTIDNKKVTKFFPGTIKETRAFIERYKNTQNFEIYGLTNFIYPFINDVFPGKIEFDPSLISVVSLDIEVAAPDGFPDLETADQPVTAISLTKRGRSITFGLKDYKPASDKNTYIKCRNEKDLLEKFLMIWNVDAYWQPDVITGWSVEEFDIPYLVHRISRELGGKEALKLSPNKFIRERDKNSKRGRISKVYELSGISILDYIDLYQRYTYTNHESYSLKFIAQYELGETKTDYSEYDSIDELYEENPQKFYDYNIQDAFLVEKFETKLNFIQQVIAIAYRAKVNYSDALTTVRPWDVIIHNHLLDRNIVVSPIKNQPERLEKIIGAYVKNPIPGMYRNIVSVDFDSLYPRIISQQNISPDTFVRKDKVPTVDHWITRGVNVELEELTLCGNGTRYRKDIRGFIPEIIDQFIAERDDFKKEMISLEKENEEEKNSARTIKIKHLDNRQKAWKILSNGLYGAMSNKYFRWFSTELAEAVTLSGQIAIRTVERELNQKLNKIHKTSNIDYIIAADTDSAYINFDPLIKVLGVPVEKQIDFLDEIYKQQFAAFIDEKCRELVITLNGYIPKLHMKRELICDKVIMRAAKNYILNVLDSEGVRYKKPKIKMKGIEAVKSSTPMVCRDSIKKCLDIIMNEDEKILQAYIAEFRTKFMELSFDRMGFPRSINDIEKWTTPTGFMSGTPIHVRGSLVFNKFLVDNNLTKYHRLIRNKDKIKFVYLKEPNPFQSYIVAVSDDLPKELKLNEWIDYEKQFEKAFLGPIESITNIIGWKTKKVPNLKGFYS